MNDLPRWTKFLSVITAPILRNIDWPQLRMTLADYLRMGDLRQRTGEKQNQKAFRLGRTSLAETPEFKQELTLKALTKKYKSAGTIANQTSSAATAWLVEHVDQWHLCRSAWAGGGIRFV